MPPERAEYRESSLERLLGIIDLFTPDTPVWTLEQITGQLGTSRSTTYRYLKELAESGFVSTVGRRGFMLGPRIMELDRQIRIGDPLILAARDIMQQAASVLGTGNLLLTGRYGERFICAHSAPEQSDVVVTYSRGQTLPRFTGSTSLTILAHLPTRTLARIFEAETAAIVAAGLSASWDAFSRALSTIRKAGIYVTHGAIDPGTICTAVPIFSNPRNVVGALCLVQKDLGQPPMTDAALVASAGADISGRLRAMFAERKHYAPIGSAEAVHAR
jgi:DNA-binding IclR family transcriptional regulator